MGPRILGTGIASAAGRTVMLQAWTRLTAPNNEAAWWIRKSAVDHDADHLGRLRVWVEELVARRTT